MKQKTSKKSKAIIATALALAVTGSTLSAGNVMSTRAQDYHAEGNPNVPKPMKVIDFSKGLNEFAMGDEYYEIITTDKLYVQKEPEEVDTGELVDANGIVYFGKEEGVYYYKMVVANQPYTLYSRKRGMFLQMGKKWVIPPVYKTKSAGLANAMETEILDKAVPYESTNAAVSGQGVMIQDEYTANSEMAIANPFAGEEIAQSIKDNGGLAFSYWIKAPAYDAKSYESSAVLRWELGEEIDYVIEPVGELQIDIDNSIFWTADGDGDETPSYVLSQNKTASPVTSIDKDGNAVVGGNSDSWHHVTVNMTNDSVEFYVDGQCVDVHNEFADAKNQTKLLEWITSPEATLHFGGAGDYAWAYGMADTSYDFAIDDLRFYGQNLTEEQVRNAYYDEVAARKAVVDVVGTSIDTGCVTDSSVDAKNAVHTSVEEIDGKSVHSIKVEKNKNALASTGAQIANPFAGKELEGATLGYWVKQEDAANTSAISFVDDANYIFHPKGSVGLAQSILYVENTGLSIFAEGYFDASICNSVQNLFYGAPDEAGQEEILNKSTEWMYITLSMDNLGVRYYINGEPAAEDMVVEPTSRFLDGYYVTMKDSKDVRTCYGAFGKSGNQGATTMMEFLTREDTKLYLGYYPTKGGQLNNKTSGCSFAGFKYTDTALNDDEVKAFYANRYEGLTIPELLGTEKPSGTDKPGGTNTPDLPGQPDGTQNPTGSDVPQSPTGPAVSQKPGTSDVPGGSEESNVMAGDVDGNMEVTLSDAQMTLRAALKIDNFNEKQAKAADVNKDKEINLADAQIILKMALKII